MSTDPAILDKLEKLLAKANGTNNQNEAAAFFAKAAELMTKHGIEQAKLDAHGAKKANEFGEVKLEGKWKTERPHHRYTRAILKHCFGVVVIKYQTRGSDGRYEVTYSMVGTKEDIQMAGYAWNMLNNTFTKLAAAYVRDNDLPRVPRYFDGFIRGCYEGFVDAWDEAKRAEMVRNNGEQYAMVLVNKEAELQNHLQTMGVKNAKQKQVTADSRAYHAGVETGRELKIHRPLENGN